MIVSKGYKYLILTVLVIAVSGCAGHYIGATYSDPYGFFSSLLHGFFFPLALMANIIPWVLSIIGISVFTDAQLAGRPNTEFLFYYVGYFLVYLHGSAQVQQASIL